MTNKSHKSHKGRFEVPTDVAVKITFSWNMKLCTYNRFGRWRWPHDFPSKFRYCTYILTYSMVQSPF